MTSRRHDAVRRGAGRGGSARRRALAAAVSAGVCIGLCLAARPVAAQAPDTVLAHIEQTFRQTAGEWRVRLLPMAQATFVVLAALEFCVSGLVWALKRQGVDELLAKFLMKFTLLAFLFSILTAYTVWVPPLVNGFVAAGERAVGTGLLSPDDIMELGRRTAVGVLHQLSLSVVVHDVAMALWAVICATLLALSYIVIAAQLVLVMIEVDLVVLGAGVLFFGFAGSRWTAPLADRLITLTMYLGVKIFLLYLIVGLGMQIARSWVPLIQSSNFFGPAGPIFQVVGGSVIFASVAALIPGRIAAHLTRGYSVGLASALQAMG